MENLEKYKRAFVEGLDLDISQVESASRIGVEKWDSIGQLNLTAILEDEFVIEFEPDDIMAFDSYAKGIEILKRYGTDLG